MQITNIVLMMRPANFGYNPETASTNSYQNEVTDMTAAEIQEAALKEFDSFTEQLKEAGVSVLVVEDTPEPVKPDAIFPNNWFTTHADGMVYLYPMKEPSRRAERRIEVIEALSNDFKIKEVVDISYNESQDLFLEGTGSMVFDHDNKTVYACISPRTSRAALLEFAGRIGYKPIAFTSLMENGQEQYHTNVVMSVCQGFAVVGMDTIPDEAERDLVRRTLEDTQHIVVELTVEQIEKHFAGNMLQVVGEEGNPYLVMSETAYVSLTPEQIETIEQFTDILRVPIPLIEKIGGGSIRCMMAEIFLPFQGMSMFF